jgi:hypothetical protein
MSKLTRAQINAALRLANARLHDELWDGESEVVPTLVPHGFGYARSTARLSAIESWWESNYGKTDLKRLSGPRRKVGSPIEGLRIARQTYQGATRLDPYTIIHKGWLVGEIWKAATVNGYWMRLAAPR